MQINEPSNLDSLLNFASKIQCIFPNFAELFILSEHYNLFMRYRNPIPSKAKLIFMNLNVSTHKNLIKKLHSQT